MTYDCINAYEDIFEAAENYLPLPRSLDTDEASEVAQTICEAMAISAKQRTAARAMLAALRDLPNLLDVLAGDIEDEFPARSTNTRKTAKTISAAIAQAEAAGITGKE